MGFARFNGARQRITIHPRKIEHATGGGVLCDCRHEAALGPFDSIQKVHNFQDTGSKVRIQDSGLSKAGELAAFRLRIAALGFLAKSKILDPESWGLVPDLDSELCHVRLRLAHRVLAVMENTRGEHRIGAALKHAVRKMLQVADTSARDDRHIEGS